MKMNDFPIPSLKGEPCRAFKRIATHKKAIIHSFTR